MRKYVTYTATEQQKEELKTLATYYGLSQSAFLRRLVAREAQALEVLPTLHFDSKEDRLDAAYTLLLRTIFGIAHSDTDTLAPPYKIRRELEKALQDAELFHARAIEVLRLHFGLRGLPLTHAACSEILGVSKPRIHQLKNRALRMLRHPRRSKRLVKLLHWDKYYETPTQPRPNQSYARR